MTIKVHKQTIWISMAVLAIFVSSVYAADNQTCGDQSQQQFGTSTKAGGRTLCSADDLIGSPVFSKKSSVSATTDRTTAMDQNADSADTYGTRTSNRDMSSTSSRNMSSTNSGDMYGTDATSGQSVQDQAMQDTEKIGSVEELVIDANQDKVSYVILNVNGRHCPVPWYAFDVKQSGKSINQQRSDKQVQSGVNTTNENVYQASTGDESMADTGQPTLFVKLSQDQLRQAPTIDSLSSDALSDPQLKQKVDAFYSKQPGLSSHAKGYSAQRMNQQAQGTTWGQSATQSQGTTQGQSATQELSAAQSQRGTQDQSTAQGQRRTQDLSTAQNQRGTQGQQIAGRQPDATGYGQVEANRQKDAITGRMAMGNLVMVSDVIGSDLQGSEDVDLGNVSDIIIDAQQGQIAYGLITFGGFLNFNQKVAAVPWSALTVSGQQETITINATQDELDAVVLQDGSINQLSEAQFAQNVHDTFNTEPYWGVYGFVPGSSNMTDPNGLGKNDRDTDRDRDTYRDRDTDQDRSSNRDRDTNRNRDTNRDRDTNRQGTENQRNSY